MKNEVDLALRLKCCITQLQRKLRRDAHPMTPAQFGLVSRLVKLGPVTIGALARAEQVSDATLSRMVDSLEQNNLVRRARDKRDRRMVYAVATREGAALTRQPDSENSLQNQLARLGPDDQASLDQALDTLERLFDLRDKD